MIVIICDGQFDGWPNSNWNEIFHEANISCDGYFELLELYTWAKLMDS